MNNSFSPAWWARNPHLQTILPMLTKVRAPNLTRQRLELSDGDFIDLDWLSHPKDGEDVLIIIHGLEGSAESHYVRRILKDCSERGLCAVVHHHRSCSGESNRLARCYHGGDTQDLHQSLAYIKHHYPNSQISAVGYSLGGNVLIKYLGERQGASQIVRAVVVSAPLKLAACATRINRGFSRVYQSYLIKLMQQKLLDKINQQELTASMPVKRSQIHNLNTFYKFDNRVTAPLHGFDGADDYYKKSSGLNFLAKICRPTLVIHAQDDPFMTPDVIPSPDKLAPLVHYELHGHGGHVGFIEGGTPFNPSYYLENRILNFLYKSAI